MSKASQFFKKTGLALAITLLPVLVAVDSTTSHAGIQEQMDKLFGDMSNVTAPGAYKTQRRGVITAGRITQKSRIFQENLVSFSPPSWKAGCGGVDLYGGSLSFISKEQIVALFRHIAANSKGYFFQLALSNTCKECATIIETFQKKIQALNEFLGNSCQLAQGLVNDASNLLPFDIQHKTGESLMNVTSNFVGDFFETRQQNDGKSPSRNLAQNDPAALKETRGNITWKQLKTNRADRWFFGGNDPLLEAILSLVGSVVVGEPKDDGSGDDSVDIATIEGYQVTLSDLIFGGKVTVYSCSGDKTECAGNDGVLPKKTVDLLGVRTMIDDILLSNDSRQGLIFKYQNHRSVTGGLTEKEKAFLETLPTGVGGMIRQLATLAPEAANGFAVDAANAIALNMVYHLTDELFRSARLALTNSKSSYRSQAISKLQEAHEQVHREYASLSSQFGDLHSLMTRYNTLIENVRKQRYIAQTATKTSQKGGNIRALESSSP